MRIQAGWNFRKAQAALRSWKAAEFPGTLVYRFTQLKSEPSNAARETFLSGTARIRRKNVSATSDRAEEAKNTPDFAPNLTRQNDKKSFYINHT